MNQLSFQKFKTTLVELKEDSPKETAEFKKLSPAEKQAVKDVFTLLGNTKGEIISKIEGIIASPEGQNMDGNDDNTDINIGDE